LGLRKRYIRIGACILGLLAMIAGVVITTLGTWGVSWIAMQMRGIPRIHDGLRFQSEWYILAACFIGIACGISFYTLIAKKLGSDNLLIGSFAGWLAATVLISLYFPGGTYLFLWPLLFSVLGAIVIFANEHAATRWRPVVLALSGIPPIVLLVPMI